VAADDDDALVESVASAESEEAGSVVALAKPGEEGTNVVAGSAEVELRRDGLPRVPLLGELVLADDLRLSVGAVAEVEEGGGGWEEEG
jgi:hypothetical protein